MKLDDVVTVKIGRNLSRGNEKDDLSLMAYSFEDLRNDLDGFFLESHASSNSHQDDSYLSCVGDVVFSFVSSKAGIVSEVNQGKIINQNFAKLLITHDDQLDRNYLCYALNESGYMRKQMAVFMQGSTVPKLTPAILKELEIRLPSIKEQQIIGNTYFLFRKRQALAKKQVELEKKFYLECLNRMEKE
ncbi:Type I restriction modification DNA specificity domain-containing protein [Thermoactinomyces sp. DSM 45891]|uniref:restriction endonuclease subunit S n=1 Tax=Thermoactinomyces sp. DSM 45891 TaxID=1761907 RepID=UPI00091313F8|nr:restriction endonuclease subunit S [Thermoactinomyces sp. DSM 45891]SFX73979.1 Type I restriction modification DNA specificity domain-containing protein [Thermoactinomyces sp. DSM 45891]